MDNKLLYKRINELPRELQYLISEYNVEHRKQTKEVLNQYFNIIYNPCRICNISVSKDIFWSVDYFINSKYNIKFHYCSNKCYLLEEEENQKEYVEIINNYILHKSIQYKEYTVDNDIEFIS